MRISHIHACMHTTGQVKRPPPLPSPPTKKKRKEKKTHLFPHPLEGVKCSEKGGGGFLRVIRQTPFFFGSNCEQNLSPRNCRPPSPSLLSNKVIERKKKRKGRKGRREIFSFSFPFCGLSPWGGGENRGGKSVSSFPLYRYIYTP